MYCNKNLFSLMNHFQIASPVAAFLTLVYNLCINPYITMLIYFFIKEKPVDVNQPTPSCDLLPLPDNRDIDSFSSVSTDWLDQSFPSDNTDSMLSNKHKTQNNRTALPVNVPTVRQPMTNVLRNLNLITKPKTHDFSPMTYEHTIDHDSELRIKEYDNSVPANLQTDISSNFTDPTHTTRPTTLNVQTDISEHQSIALLDEVIEGHSQNLTQTSFVSMQTVTSRISGDVYHKSM